MTILPLDRLGLGWRSHLSALWWVGLLYRKPLQFYRHYDRVGYKRAVVAGLILLWQFNLYTIILIPIKYYINISHNSESDIIYYIFSSYLLLLRRISIGVGCGIIFGVAVGIARGRSPGIIHGFTYGLSVGITVGIAAGLTISITSEIGFGILVGMALSVIFGVSYRGIAWAIAAIAVQLAVGNIGWDGIAFAIFVGTVVLRAYYIPFHILFVWLISVGRFYRFHPIAWDDLCRVPFPGLHRLLLAYAAHAPEAADREITRLIDTYPSQRAAALLARTILLIRQTADAPLTEIDKIAANLPQGDKGYLAQVPLLRNLIPDIAQQQRRIDTVPRPSIREPLARQLCETIQAFGNRVAGFNEPLATEFRTAARAWAEVADRQWRAAKAVIDRQPTQQVFRAGTPVDISHEAFILRAGVVGDIAAQLALATGCPGLILYGRRRTGKSTVLRNLHSFLGPETPTLVLSMEAPALFTSQDGFCGSIHAELCRVWPNDPLAPERSDLPGLMAGLAQANARLAGEGRRLLITLDEYENIDAKIGEGVFTPDLLHTLRESIQTHSRIVWIFAGSHAIEELPHAAWPSFLISARTIEVPMFSAPETALLLTEPMRSSPLWGQDDPTRPRFAPELWGPGGIERIHAETGGWPHLVQLVAETVIDLLNQGTQRNADAALLERALDKAVVSGDTVLRELVERECRLPGEWDYLRAFRRVDTQPPPHDEAIERSLRRRLLVEVAPDGQWRMRVPLMQRWLRERT